MELPKLYGRYPDVYHSISSPFTCLKISPPKQDAQQGDFWPVERPCPWIPMALSSGHRGFRRRDSPVPRDLKEITVLFNFVH